MNKHILNLTEVAQKPSRIILGLMSGTSMDGLDLALCRITGSGPETEIELLEFDTWAYSSEFTEKLDEVVSVSECRMQDLCIMHNYVGNYTAHCVLEMLDRWGWQPGQVDCIASHGQTIYHAPKSRHKQSGLPDATLQIGDGDHIARRTGILTISDFRQKHTAAGGEGAPMAALVDRMVFADADTDRLLLNIGGIANFTFVPALSSDQLSQTADTGPGNTLMNAAARRLLQKPFDDEGRIARDGELNQVLLEVLKSNHYFELPLPKTTGPELFSWEYLQAARRETGTEQLPTEDLLATLAAFTADTIVEAVRNVGSSHPVEILVTGGGLHNTYLMELLRNRLPDASFASFSDLFFDPDAKEAVCFAVLANEMLAGDGFYMDEKQEEKINFGKISFAC